MRSHIHTNVCFEYLPTGHHYTVWRSGFPYLQPDSLPVAVVCVSGIRHIVMGTGEFSSVAMCEFSPLAMCKLFPLAMCELSPLCMCEFSSLSMCELSSLAMCGHRMFPSLRLLSRSVTRNVIIAIVC